MFDLPQSSRIISCCFKIKPIASVFVTLNIIIAHFIFVFSFFIFFCWSINSQKRFFFLPKKFPHIFFDCSKHKYSYTRYKTCTSYSDNGSNTNGRVTKISVVTKSTVRTHTYFKRSISLCVLVSM